MEPSIPFELNEISTPLWNDKDVIREHMARQRYNVIAIGPESQVSEVYILRDGEATFDLSRRDRRILVSHKRPYFGEIDGPFVIVPRKNIENSVGLADGKLAALSADYGDFLKNGQCALQLYLYSGVPPFLPTLRPEAFFSGSLANYATTGLTSLMEVPAFGREYLELAITTADHQGGAIFTYSVIGINYFGTREVPETLATSTIAAAGSVTFNYAGHFDAYRVRGNVDAGSVDVNIDIKLRDAA